MTISTCKGVEIAVRSTKHCASRFNINGVSHTASIPLCVTTFVEILEKTNRLHKIISILRRMNRFFRNRQHVHAWLHNRTVCNRNVNPHRNPYLTAGRRRTLPLLDRSPEPTLYLLLWRETFSKAYRQGSGYVGTGTITTSRKSSVRGIGWIYGDLSTTLWKGLVKPTWAGGFPECLSLS